MNDFYMKLGKRAKDMRELLGLSQEFVAKQLDINRVSLSNVEKGKRKVSADELVTLSGMFNISTDILLDLKKDIDVVLEKTDFQNKKRQDIRINVPQKNLKKFKEVLLYILNKVGAKLNVGQTVIYKLLYFIDFNHYEKYEEQLIGATYIKNQYGPTPKEFAKIVNEMESNQEIVKVEGKYFEYPLTKYLPLEKPDFTILKAHEIKTIDEVLERLSDMNATRISEYSHGDVPWLTADNGDVIEYESVFYRTPEYSVIAYSNNERETV